MSEVFLKIVNMSISASWIVLAVLLLRLLLKKAPKWITVLLWGIVAIRLIFPFSIESVMSLIPSAETIRPEIMTDKNPAIYTGIPILNNSINPLISSSFSPTPEVSANPLQIWIPILSIAWTSGFVILLSYTMISFWCVRRKVGTAVLLRDNIFQSETVGSPFVLGIIKPRIYLPFNMNKQDEELVIAHEEAHIQRKDHFGKPFGFILLTLHWFNPLMWLGYVLLCRDIELACDEKVVKELSNEQRADYSQTLLTCSVNRHMIAACPLTFGEVGVKDRVKSVLNYKKPTLWIISVAIIALVSTAVCLLTNPSSIKLESIEHLSIGSITESTVQVYISNGETYDSIGALSKDLLKNLTDIKISRTEISKSRSEDRDKSHTIVLQTEQDAQPTTYSYIKGLYIYFNYDFTSIWVNNGVKPTLSYKVKNPYEAERVFKSISAYNVSVPAVNGVSVPENIALTSNSYKFKWEKDTATLSLSTVDNTCRFSFSLLSSYWPIGTYEDTGDYIVMKTDDGKNKYTFKKENDKLRFVASKSSVMPSYAYSSGAKDEVCVSDGAVFEKIEATTVGVFDRIVFDIDEDGKDETCVLGYGPTSGLFTFTFRIDENGTTEYFNIFNSPFYHLSFIEQEGSLKIKGVTQGATHIFDILFEDGNIIIPSDEQNIGYWGEQGINNAFR